jgi:AcrR family transcriptional regulator
MGAFETAVEEEMCGKAAQIITAAREAFLEQGYDAVSMDTVAKRAGVAKQTVYAHFSSKDALFLAVVKGEQRRMKIALPDLPADRELPVREKLILIGRRFLEGLLNPTVISLFRLAVAEANRFPTLGRSIREAGPKQTNVDLAQFLSCAAAQGALVVPDPLVAASHFIALIRGELHVHCMLDPAFKPAPDEITNHLDLAVDCFLARYGASAARPCVLNEAPS